MTELKKYLTHAGIKQIYADTEYHAKDTKSCPKNLDSLIKLELVYMGRPIVSDTTASVPGPSPGLLEMIAKTAPGITSERTTEVGRSDSNL